MDTREARLEETRQEAAISNEVEAIIKAHLARGEWNDVFRILFISNARTILRPLVTELHSLRRAKG
jgi:hypothetical protein